MKLFPERLGFFSTKINNQKQITTPTNNKIIDEITNNFEEDMKPFLHSTILTSSEIKEIFLKFEKRFQELNKQNSPEIEKEKLEKILFNTCKTADTEFIMKCIKKSTNPKLGIKYINYLFPEEKIKSYGFFNEKITVLLEDGKTLLVENNEIQKTIKDNHGNKYPVESLRDFTFTNNYVICNIGNTKQEFPVKINPDSKEVRICI